MPEESSFQYAEYARPVAKKGKNRRARTLLILLYVFFAIGYSALFVAINLPMVIAIMPVFTWMLVFFTWGLVSYEYGVKVGSGDVSFVKIHGKREKVLLSFPVKSILAAASYKKDPEAYKAHNPTAFHDFRTDPDEKNDYYAIFEKDGVREAVLFDCTTSVATSLRYYNKEVVIDKDYLSI